MPDQRLEKLKSILQLVDESISKKDFEANFKILIDFVKTLKENTAQTLDAIKEMLSSATAKIESDQTSEMEKMDKTLMAKCEKELNAIMLEKDAMVSEMDKRCQDMEGMMPDEALIAKQASEMAVSEVLSRLPPKDDFNEELSKAGDLIATALENLSEDDKLKISAIKGLQEILDELRQLKTQRLGGGGGLQRGVADSLYAPIGTTGGVNFETPTGDVNSINTTYTVLNIPKFIIIDGITYFSGYGYEISGLTITTDIPPTGFIRSFY